MGAPQRGCATERLVSQGIRRKGFLIHVWNKFVLGEIAIKLNFHTFFFRYLSFWSGGCATAESGWAKAGAWSGRAEKQCGMQHTPFFLCDKAQKNQTSLATRTRGEASYRVIPLSLQNCQCNAYPLPLPISFHTMGPFRFSKPSMRLLSFGSSIFF